MYPESTGIWQLNNLLKLNYHVFIIIKELTDDMAILGIVDKKIYIIYASFFLELGL